MSVDVDRVTTLVRPVVEAAGFALVRVAITGGRDLTLQVMAEDPATGQMTLDQCANLSRALSDMLDAADPIPQAFRLEVSSPGIDRPLTRPEDFRRFAPHVARIELATGLAIGGAVRKRFQGRLKGTEGGDVLLDAEGVGDIRLPLADIRTARLVLTQDLIAATAPLSADGADTLIEQSPDGRRQTRTPATRKDA
jgi:ribosome maturation factor RimP